MNTIALNNLIELNNRFSKDYVDFDSGLLTCESIIDKVVDFIKRGYTNNLELCLNILLKNKIFDFSQANALLDASALLTSDQLASIAYPCYTASSMEFITKMYLEEFDENIIKECLEHPAVLIPRDIIWQIDDNKELDIEEFLSIKNKLKESIKKINKRFYKNRNKYGSYKTIMEEYQYYLKHKSSYKHDYPNLYKNRFKRFGHNIGSKYIKTKSIVNNVNKNKRSRRVA